MTERGRKHVRRSPDMLSVGPSALHWDGTELTIDLDEVGMPIPRRVRGQVRVRPELVCDTAFDLDPAGRHRWQPIAPRAHVEVEMRDPDLAWTGSGYFDSNFGNEPLERGFSRWNWSRAHLKDDVAVFYEGTRRGGAPFELALRCDRQGVWRDIETPPPLARLPRTGWLMPRLTRSDAGTRPKVLKTWEDGPFYARTALATRIYGENVEAVHESLSLDRLDSPITRQMLPWRMPRAFF